MTSHAVTVAGFALIIVVMLVMEAVARRRRSIPPAGNILVGAMSNRAGRLTVLLVWMWFGWHFLAR